MVFNFVQQDSAFASNDSDKSLLKFLQQICVRKTPQQNAFYCKMQRGYIKAYYYVLKLENHWMLYTCMYGLSIIFF